MKRILFSLLALFCVVNLHAQTVTGTLTITNAPVNTSTVTVAGQVFTWTNGTPVGPNAVLITNTFGGDATNLFNVASLVLPILTGTTLTSSASNVVQFTRINLTASITTNWATLAFSTNGTAPSTNVATPIANLPGFSTASRQAVESSLVSDINAYNQTALATNTPAVQYLVDLFNAQTLSNKVLILASIYSGVVSNCTVTNALSLSTKGNINQTNNFSAQNALNFQNDAVASGTLNLYTNNVLLATFALNTDGTVAAYNASGQAMFSFDQHLNFTGYGTNNTLPNQTLNAANSILTAPLANARYVALTNGASLGETATNFTTVGTNTLGGDIVIPVFVNSSLANGNNATVNAGGSGYVQITSGPSSAFTICGIKGGIDGYEVTFENATGQTMTVANQSGIESTAANRIITMTGADRVISNNAFTIRYDGSVSRWKIISVN